MAKTNCPTCSNPTVTRYPGNDPENGPARPECPTCGWDADQEAAAEFEAAATRGEHCWNGVDGCTGSCGQCKSEEAMSEAANLLYQEYADDDKPMNQCDGCARGLEVREGIHDESDGRPFIGCTKDRYTTKFPTGPSCRMCGWTEAEGCDGTKCT